MFCTLDQLRDYSLRAGDGVLGSVDDAIIDERDWNVRYLKVSTGPWLPGREVLIDVEEWHVADLMVDVGDGSDIRFLLRPGDIERIDWASRSLLCAGIPDNVFRPS